MVDALAPGTDWPAIVVPTLDTAPPAAVTMLLDESIVWPRALADAPLPAEPVPEPLPVLPTVEPLPEPLPEPLLVPPVVAVVSPEPDPAPPVPWLSEPEPPHADSDTSAATPAAIMIIRSPA